MALSKRLFALPNSGTQGPNMTTNARDVLVRFECREMCAEFGDPPCFEVHEDQHRIPFSPCSDCAKMADARLSALHSAGLAVVPMVATEEMCEAADAYLEGVIQRNREAATSHGWTGPMREPSYDTNDGIWRAMIAAALAATQPQGKIP
jgi:hypothetical protein